MMKRLYAMVWIAGCASVLLAPATARAQVTRVEPRQSVGFNLGYFALRGEDTRIDGDVLVADLPSLLFEVDDFNGFTFGGEWLVGVGEYFEAGFGVGFYQHTVPTIYRDFTDDEGREIEQELKLRVVPMTATARFLPVGRGSVEPYVGAGIGVFNWRYSETGEFIDFSDDTIFRAQYTASGNAVGPVVLGGIRFPVADVFSVGGEIRYQHAQGKIDPVETGLLGDRVDLGGWTSSFTMHLRF